MEHFKHFKLSDESIEHNSHKLFRIIATVDIPSANVAAGDMGGYVEHENNLHDFAWVADDAKVYERAKVSGYAIVMNRAEVHGDAKVSGYVEVCNDAKVYEYAQLHEFAKVYDNVEVYDNAKLSGNAEIYNSAKIFGSAALYDNVEIYDRAKVYGIARMFGNAKIYDDVEVYGEAIIGDNASIYDKTKVLGYSTIQGNTIIYGQSILNGNVNICCNLEFNDAHISSSQDFCILSNVGPLNNDILSYKNKDGDIIVSIDCEVLCKLEDFEDALQNIGFDKLTENELDEYRLIHEVIWLKMMR